MDIDDAIRRPRRANFPMYWCDPDVHLRDDDWWTCPACHQPITPPTGGDQFGSLLAGITAHHGDPPAGAAPPTHRYYLDPQGDDVPKPKTRLRIYSHTLLQHPHNHLMRWRIGYLVAPADQPGLIRVSRPIADQICSDLARLRTAAIDAAVTRVEFYEEALAEVDATLPRLRVDREYLVADWRHVEHDSDAIRSTGPDPDGCYTIGLGLSWRQNAADRCDTVHDDSTWLPPTTAAYRAYVACFTSPTMALLDPAARAGIAVAYLDRGAIEADRVLTDDEWDKITYQLDWYDQHVSGSGELNASFLDQPFAAAGVPRYLDDEDEDTDPGTGTGTGTGGEGEGDTAVR